MGRPLLDVLQHQLPVALGVRHVFIEMLAIERAHRQLGFTAVVGRADVCHRQRVVVARVGLDFLGLRVGGVIKCRVAAGIADVALRVDRFVDRVGKGGCGKIERCNAA